MCFISRRYFTGYGGQSQAWVQRGKKNNNPAYPDYTPSIFPQAVLKELTKSTTLDRFKRAQKRKAPSTTLVSRKERKVKKQLEFEETINNIQLRAKGYEEGSVGFWWLTDAE
uniref:Uncharacterized protein n=1 Tax=Knipowitschia caucasica TaxID=637954 RepID=A0AAV2JKX6_KNICA